jgi:beta-1,4-mannosyl-glycoprotein beta-1,4-N-acetylglucosaminyltransferase
MAVYDCFTFFNELDLLEIRLHELDPVVDKFVLVESPMTFTNQPKPLYYAENKDRFAQFNNKIIHIVLEDHPIPPHVHYHVNEGYQRNMIIRGLWGAKLSDQIIISDVDEIPKRYELQSYLQPGILDEFAERVIIFKGRVHSYYLNVYTAAEVSSAYWVEGPKMVRYKLLLDRGGSPNNIRRCPGYLNHPIKGYSDHTIQDASWHFTSQGGREAIKTKILASIHLDEWRHCLSNDVLDALLSTLRTPWDRDNKLAIAEPHTLPQYVQDNWQKFSHLIYNPDNFPWLRNMPAMSAAATCE